VCTRHRFQPAAGQPRKGQRRLQVDWQVRQQSSRRYDPYFAERGAMLISMALLDPPHLPPQLKMSLLLPAAPSPHAGFFGASAGTWAKRAKIMFLLGLLGDVVFFVGGYWAFTTQPSVRLFIGQYAPVPAPLASLPPPKASAPAPRPPSWEPSSPTKHYRHGHIRALGGDTRTGVGSDLPKMRPSLPPLPPRSRFKTRFTCF